MAETTTLTEQGSLVTRNLASAGECYEDQFVRIDQEGLTLKQCYLGAKHLAWAELSKLSLLKRKDLGWYQYSCWGGCGMTWWACDIKRRHCNRSLIVLTRLNHQFRLGASVLDAEAAVTVIRRFAPSLLYGAPTETRKPATPTASDAGRKKTV